MNIIQDSFMGSFFINKIIKGELDTSNFFSLIELFDIWYESEESKQICFDVIATLLENWDKVNDTLKKPCIDLIESVGLYPYIYKEGLTLSSDQYIRGLNFKSDNTENIFFHDEQFQAMKLINDYNLILSAPTSFGKSQLIEELVASGEYKNIIIIQPTLALLDETRKKLKSKYGMQYKLLVRTSQEFNNTGSNIFLFTAERVFEYDNFPKIDLLIIDEFYKMSGKRGDDRSGALNKAFYRILKEYNPRFFLLGPHIKGVPKNFCEKHNACFIKASYSPVRSVEHNVDSKSSDDKKKKLFAQLSSLKNEQALIYCKGPQSARNLALEYHRYRKENKLNKTNKLPVLEWIEENVDKDWYLYSLLQDKIAYHNRILPRHISSSIIEYFNDKKLDVIFCTTTIIEGVNTSAKHVFYFDDSKGTNKNHKPIKVDSFDYKNIKGRAGRFMQHYTGEVHNYSPPPIDGEDFMVDFPIFEQNNISDDMMLYIDKEDRIYTNNEQKNLIENLTDSEAKLFKKNGIGIKGQLSLIDEIREHKYSYLQWSDIPNKDNLESCLNLMKKHFPELFQVGGFPQTWELAYYAIQYSFNHSLKELISKRISKLIADEEKNGKSQGEKAVKGKFFDIKIIKNKAINDIFDITRNWFEYKLINILSILDLIQKYAFSLEGEKAGDYTLFIAKIENSGFDSEFISILDEYGVPKSAILKLTNLISSSKNETEMIDLLKGLENSFQKLGLNEYEISKIKPIL